MMQVPGNPFHTAQSFDMMSIPGTSHMNGHHHNGLSDSALGGSFCLGQKRKRESGEVERMEEPRQKRCNHCECGTSRFKGRNFLPVKGSTRVFQSELVKPKGETMYRPLVDDVLINMRHIEQVSFESGAYFIGDHRGNYVRSDHGHVINMWRYDANQQRLFVSRSLLFTDPMNFNELQSILHTM